MRCKKSLSLLGKVKLEMEVAWIPDLETDILKPYFIKKQKQ